MLSMTFDGSTIERTGEAINPHNKEQGPHNNDLGLQNEICGGVSPSQTLNSAYNNNRGCIITVIS